MHHSICVACGTQFSETAPPPESCPICEDERQFINPKGQIWTTLEQLRATHSNLIEAEGESLFGIGTEPSFAIGQRALLVQSPGGNLLWDCVTLLDEQTVARIKELGGIRAIAISHPHFYSAMVEWSRAFNDAPIHLHAADRHWVMRDESSVRFWEGATQQLWDGMTLVNCGGHFEGGTVLHWPGGGEGRGALLTGDNPSRDGSSLCQLHAQLSKFDPAVRSRCDSNRRSDRTACLRKNLRRVVAAQYPVRCQRRCPSFRGAISSRNNLLPLERALSLSVAFSSRHSSANASRSELPANGTVQ